MVLVDIIYRYYENRIFGSHVKFAEVSSFFKFLFLTSARGSKFVGPIVSPCSALSYPFLTYPNLK